MATGGFDEDGCVVLWEDYPSYARANDKQGRPIGLLRCMTHDHLVAFGVSKGSDDARAELECERAKEERDGDES